MQATEDNDGRVFKPGTEFQRDPGFYHNIGLPNSLGFLTDFKQHGTRRKMFNQVFTLSAVSDSLPTLARNIDEIGDIFTESLLEGKAVDIQNVFGYMAVRSVNKKKTILSNIAIS